MKMEVPQVDLPLEVLAWTKVTEDILNIYKQSCRLQACIFAICTEGTMKVSINLLEYEVHPNDLLHYFPEQSYSSVRKRKRLVFVLPDSLRNVSDISTC